MAQYNVQWTEIHNVEIEAENEKAALSIWQCEDYDKDDECIDIVEAMPEIEEIKE